MDARVEGHADQREKGCFDGPADHTNRVTTKNTNVLLDGTVVEGNNAVVSDLCEDSLCSDQYNYSKRQSEAALQI
jgi:hypothetical protein